MTRMKYAASTGATMPSVKMCASINNAKKSAPRMIALSDVVVIVRCKAQMTQGSNTKPNASVLTPRV